MKFTSFIFFTSILLLSSCSGRFSDAQPEDFNMVFNLAEIVDVSTSVDGLYMIEVEFSDKDGNQMRMKAGSMCPSLEAGYYSLTAEPASRLEADVSLVTNGQMSDVTGGMLRVTRKNEAYTITADLTLDDGAAAHCSILNKNIWFETMKFETPSGELKGELLQDLTIDSQILGQQMKYSIYLPEGYAEGQTYPVLYILHGMYGNNNDWLGSGYNNGKMAIAAGNLADDGGDRMIVVSPEGRNAFYCNGYENSMQYMTYFFEEFMPYIEGKYKVSRTRETRMIGGLSMGGYGSLYYGMLHPELFSHVYACSPAVGIEGAPVLEDFLKNVSPEDLPGITIEIGTEDFLYSANQSFTRTLDGYNVAYEYITRSGAHDWPFWQACTPKILDKAGGIF